jgi:ATP synthase protein I
MFRIQSRPIRVVLRWQLAATVMVALIAGYIAGMHGAVSAVLGGGINLVAGLVFALMAARATPASMEGAMLGALRAEGAKIGTIVVLMWLVLATYKAVSIAAFFAAFVITVVIFSMAFFVRDTQPQNGVSDGR